MRRVYAHTRRLYELDVYYIFILLFVQSCLLDRRYCFCFVSSFSLALFHLRHVRRRRTLKTILSSFYRSPANYTTVTDSGGRRLIKQRVRKRSVVFFFISVPINLYLSPRARKTRFPRIPVDDPLPFATAAARHALRGCVSRVNNSSFFPLFLSHLPRKNLTRGNVHGTRKRDTRARSSFRIVKYRRQSTTP